MNLMQLLKELILLLVATNVIWFLLPRWIRKIIKGTGKLVYKSCRFTTLYAKRHYKTYYKQDKKAAPVQVEQPTNVIKIIYPDGTIKKYPKAK